MEQKVLFSNPVKDYYTNLIIEKEDSIAFVASAIDPGLLLVSYTQSAEHLNEQPKVMIFHPSGSLPLLDLTAITALREKGNYSYGVFAKQSLFHPSCRDMDKPVTYRKFENIQRLLLSGKNSLLSVKETFAYNISMGMISPTNRVLEGHDYTYGVEIETSHGKVSNYKDLNANCVYDGSLKDEHGNCYGGEYVTGVLRGDMGLLHLKKITERLVSSNCGVNNKCSIHIHIGNINWSAEQIMLAWALGCQLEDELFTMMPHSRRNNEFCQLLKAKYPLEIDFKGLKSLTPLDEKISTQRIYNDIYSLVVSGTHSMPNADCNKMSNHPEGAKQRYNHNAQRYCWLNFVPLMFNIRDNNDARTIEFRCHSSTLNYKKIENWLKICVSFVSLIDNHSKVYKQGKIGKLADVINLAFPKTGSSLNTYVAERKKKFQSQREAKITENDEYNEIIKLGDGSIKEVVCV